MARRMKPLVFSVLLVMVSGCAALRLGSGTVDTRSAFESLRGVEGEWSGEFMEGPWLGEGGGEGVEEEGEARLIEGRYHVTAGGSVVEATLFGGTPRETVMMFHLDDGKLILTQYGLSESSTTLSADFLARSSAGPEGVNLRFLRTRTATPAATDGEYLHHVGMLITKDGTQTFWTFYEDGAPTKAVYVELTKRNSPQAATAMTQ